MSELKLGATAKDIVTQFKGVITARADYLTGCTQFLLQPKGLDKEGKCQDSQWFDEGRLLPTNAKLVKVFETAHTGGPQRHEAPKK